MMGTQEYNGLFERVSLRKAVIGFLCAAGLSILFAVVYAFTSSNATLKNSLEFSLDNMPLSLFTSLFVHNHDVHVRDNTFFMLTLGTLFFYYRGAGKGIVYFILFGVTGHLLEIVFAVPVSILFRFYMDGIKGHDLSSIGFWILSPSGAGSSGSLAGMVAIDSHELFQSLKQSFDDFLEKNDTGSKLEYITTPSNMLRHLIPFLITIIPLLERTYSDLSAFFKFLWSHFRVLEPDIITGTIAILAEVFQDTTGNKYLAHFFGMVAGFLVLSVETPRSIHKRMINKIRSLFTKN
ncbi:MAG: hypothetical protein ACFFD4_15225 [Candidatus Odinarchaeota archaeon]